MTAARTAAATPPTNPPWRKPAVPSSFSISVSSLPNPASRNLGSKSQAGWMTIAQLPVCSCASPSCLFRGPRQHQRGPGAKRSSGLLVQLADHEIEVLAERLVSQREMPPLLAIAHEAAAAHRFREQRAIGPRFRTHAAIGWRG